MTRGPIPIFDAAAVRKIQEVVWRELQRPSNLPGQTARRYPRASAASPPEIYGRPTADIDPGTDGQVQPHDDGGPTTDPPVDVTNPHTITLVADDYVRCATVQGFDKLIASPDSYTTCPTPVPANVSDPV